MTPTLSFLIAHNVLHLLDAFLYHRQGNRDQDDRSERTTRLVRGLLVGGVTLVTAWSAPGGAFAWALFALIVAVVVSMVRDFSEDTAARTVAPAERVLHVMMAFLFGAFVAAIAPAMWGWTRAATGFGASMPDALGWGACASGVLVLAVALRDAAAVMAARRGARIASAERPA